MREDFFRRSGLPSDTKQVPEYLARRLGKAYERFLNAVPKNSYAVVDKDGWHLSAEPTEKLDQECRVALNCKKIHSEGKKLPLTARITAFRCH
jgi:hypothetical protein